MPEGDTIFRAARRLDAALRGQVVTRFETVFPHLSRIDHETPLKGRSIESVEAAGKHLVIHLSGGLHLRTHMRMNGSWHLYRTGERWQRARSRMRIVLETHGWVAVGFDVPVAELLTDREAETSSVLGALGPDLLGGTFDIGEALQRLEGSPEMEIGEAVLSQRIVAGIGNVYKSEILFMEGIQPFRRVDSLGRDQLERLLERSRKVMLLNVREDDLPGRQSGRWTTGRLNPGERLWVYGRRGKACRRCGMAIEMARQGTWARVTFWCPGCQR